MTRGASSLAAQAALIVLAGCASTPHPPAQPARVDPISTPRRSPEVAASIHRRAPEPTPPRFTVAAGGDVIFGRYIRGVLRRAGGPTPFAALRERLAGADLALLNLETPITDLTPPLPRNPFGRWLKFRGPSENVAHLAGAGVDIAITANNHAEDCGLQGIADTHALLSAQGISVVGTSADGDPYAPLTIERAGVRVTIIAATSKRNRGKPRPGQRPPVAFLTTDQMLATLPARVRALREAGPGDLIIVSLHWGSGFQRGVHPKQVAVAHALIDAGADLLLGHHAHLLQAVERYGDGLIVYGMGNLIFDMRDLRGRQTALFEITLAPHGERWRPERLAIRPLIIDGPDIGPRWARGAVAERILAPVARDTRRRFHTDVERRGDVLVWRRRL